MVNLLWIIPLSILLGVLAIRLLMLPVFLKSRKVNDDEPISYPFFLSDENGGIAKPLRFPNGTTVISVPKESIYLDTQGISPVLGEVSVNDRKSFGSSGITPGGVPYTQVPGKGGALISKGRNRIRRAK